MPLAQLRALADRGELRRDDSVWTDGMPGWVPASSRPELFPAGAATPGVLLGR
jgi:hypothetical protein